MSSLVIGASGSLGSHLVNALIARGEDVTAVARSSRPSTFQHGKWVRVDDYGRFRPESSSWNRVFLAHGCFVRKRLDQTSESEIYDLVNANLVSQILLTRNLLTAVSDDFSIRRDIVFTGSTSSYTGFSDSSVYCATKFALRGFIEALNAEWSNSNLRFWLVSMGSMNNRMGRMVPGVNEDHLLSPGEVANDIVSRVLRESPAFEPEIVIRRRWIP